MYDLKATADALAAKFVGISVGGQTFSPTASLPNQIARGPVLLVYPPSGVLDVVVSRIRRDELDFPVKLLLDPLDVPARTDALYAWFNALRDVVRDGETLNLSYVSWVQCIAARIDLDGEQYAGSTFDVVELTYRIHFGDLQP